MPVSIKQFFEIITLTLAYNVFQFHCGSNLHTCTCIVLCKPLLNRTSLRLQGLFLPRKNKVVYKENRKQKRCWRASVKCVVLVQNWFQFLVHRICISTTPRCQRWVYTICEPARHARHARQTCEACEAWTKQARHAVVVGHGPQSMLGRVVSSCLVVTNLRAVRISRNDKFSLQKGRKSVNSVIYSISFLRLP